METVSKTILTCDSCGKETPPSNVITLYWNRRTMSKTMSVTDLCLDCMLAISTTIDGIKARKQENENG